MSSSFKPILNFDSITPQTTKGDLIGRTTVGATRVPVGADNTVLTADSSTALGVKWASATANLPVFTLTGATTLPATSQIVLASGTTFAIGLPAAASNSGLYYQIMKTDGIPTPISISGTGFAGVTLCTIKEEYSIVCDGTTFWPINHYSFMGITNLGGMSIVGGVSNPTKGASVLTNIVWFSRAADFGTLKFQYLQAVGGTIGSGVYGFKLPTGVTIDVSKVKTGANYSYGSGKLSSAADGVAATSVDVLVSISDATTLNVNVTRQVSGNLNQSYQTWQSAASNQGVAWSDADLNFDFFAHLPILGWGP